MGKLLSYLMGIAVLSMFIGASQSALYIITLSVYAPYNFYNLLRIVASSFISEIPPWMQDTDCI